MRFHVLGLPHTISSPEYSACAYTQKAVKFCKMMTALGHDVIHYGHEDSVVEAEHVTVLERKYHEMSYPPEEFKSRFFKFSDNDLAYIIFKENAAREIAERKREGDFILPFWGPSMRDVCDCHPDIITVEPGIGYAGGHWAEYKVFESYAILHAYYGLHGVGTCNVTPKNIVIPNYFDSADFDFKTEKKEFALFIGRVYEGKGIHTAFEATRQAKIPLIVAGQMGDEEIEFPSHAKYVGYANANIRRQLMSDAKALIIASEYVEPFGGVQVEALLSGTPTITSDIGAFTENNHNGITGYRCRTIDEYARALQNIDSISPSSCRVYGEQFLLENIAPRYEDFFKRILHDKGIVL